MRARLPSRSAKRVSRHAARESRGFTRARKREKSKIFNVTWNISETRAHSRTKQDFLSKSWIAGIIVRDQGYLKNASGDLTMKIMAECRRRTRSHNREDSGVREATITIGDSRSSRLYLSSPCCESRVSPRVRPRARLESFLTCTHHR